MKSTQNCMVALLALLSTGAFAQVPAVGALAGDLLTPPKRPGCRPGSRSCQGMRKVSRMDSPRAAKAVKEQVRPDTKDLVQQEAIAAGEADAAMLNGCENGWKGFGNNCYKAFVQKETFAGASNRCNKAGAFLVSLHSSEENDFVRTKVAKRRPNASYWIGLQRGVNGFYWSDGSNYDYDNAAKAPTMKTLTPENLKEAPSRILDPLPKEKKFLEDCWKLGVDKEWNLLNCSQAMYFICEKAATKTGITVPTTPRSTTEGSTTSSTSADPRGIIRDEEGFEIIQDVPFYMLNGILPVGAAAAGNLGLANVSVFAGTQKSAAEKADSFQSRPVFVGSLVALAVVVIITVGVLSWQRRRNGNFPFAWRTLKNEAETSMIDTNSRENINECVRDLDNQEYAIQLQTQPHLYGTI